MTTTGGAALDAELGKGQELERLIEAAYRVSSDVGQEVEEALDEAVREPLGEADFARLLGRVITVLRRSASVRENPAARHILEGDLSGIVEEVLAARHGRETPPRPPGRKPVQAISLLTHNGIEPYPVQPRQRFHGLEVAMDAGFVRTTDLKLWEGNERL
ncbi:MAG: hypothetical protein QOD63_1359, partial [Actinomycetota bacterium]|nr:hypothetical protein [Actinomycetota bacterium]